MKENLAAYLLFTLVCFLSCNTTEPPPPDNRELTLTFEDASCTEAWLNLTIFNLQLPTTIMLKQDNQDRSVINLIKEDTLIYVDSLLPNKTYNFKVEMPGSRQSITSNEVTAVTMDTTSNNFIWQSWTFGGEAGSSTIYDVAIIDENNIWAVGAIYLKDSLGNPDPNAYNAIHWNGTEWKPFRIMFYTVCGQQSRTSYPAKSIFAFNENEIWIGMYGDQLVKIENGVQIETICSPWSFTINKIWGTSSNDLYIVGNNGNITHYNGTSWQKIESGTDLQFLDIYGATDSKTGEQQILSVCTQNLPLGQGIFRIKENKATQISSYPIQWELYSIWFVPNRHYYVVGNGIYEKNFLSDNIWIDNGFNVTHYATTKIKGNEINDVFVVGAFGEFLHFNGVSWKTYLNETGWFNGSFASLDVKNNLIVAVGFDGAQAKIIIGKRTN